jgi:hypothetical protein
VYRLPALWQKQLSSKQLEDSAVQVSCCLQNIGSLAETAVEQAARGSCCSGELLCTGYRLFGRNSCLAHSYRILLFRRVAVYRISALWQKQLASNQLEDLAV